MNKKVEIRKVSEILIKVRKFPMQIKRKEFLYKL